MVGTGVSVGALVGTNVLVGSGASVGTSVGTEVAVVPPACTAVMLGVLVGGVIGAVGVGKQARVASNSPNPTPMSLNRRRLLPPVRFTGFLVHSSLGIVSSWFLSGAFRRNCCWDTKGGCVSLLWRGWSCIYWRPVRMHHTYLHVKRTLAVLAFGIVGEAHSGATAAIIVPQVSAVPKLLVLN